MSNETGRATALKYWGYFAAKLLAAGLFLTGLWKAMGLLLPPPATFLRHKVSPFPQDLSWTSAILVFWLISVGTFYLILWDQRRRCRICLRILRMPVERGSWSKATLLSPPETESICPFGHGTLAQPEVHGSTRQDPVWTEHQDIWKELEDLEQRKS